MKNHELHKIKTLASQFPNYDNDLKDECIKIFRSFLMENIKTNTDKSEWPVEIKFMSELDNPVPDYILMKMYRESIKI